MYTQAKASRKRRELQRQVFHTEPLTPQAGQACEVFYNPDITNLRGRPEIWIRGGFNRWGHPQAFGPLQMQPALRGGAGFYRGTVQVKVMSATGIEPRLGPSRPTTYGYNSPEGRCHAYIACSKLSQSSR